MVTPPDRNRRLAELEMRLVALALRLGARTAGGRLSPGERRLAAAARRRKIDLAEVDTARRTLLAGGDPFAARFEAARPLAVRRRAGAVYTPAQLVAPMVRWALAHAPNRVVDPGSGSGRFSAAVALAARSAGLDCEIVAVDTDPLATLMTRAALATIGHRRATVINADFLTLALPRTDGSTAYVGNPPYVRHQRLGRETKAWAKETARHLGRRVSGLAGLQALFLLATAAKAKPGDVGCFVTSGEWLDARYGAIVRELLLDVLGGEAVAVLPTDHEVFGAAETTASIVCFRVGGPTAGIRFARLARGGDTAGLDIDALGIDGPAAGVTVERDALERAGRWSQFVDGRQSRSRRPEGFVELGELCAVHRGTATGANAVWIGPRETFDLPPDVLFPAVTRALELFEAGDRLTLTDHLLVVVDLPAGLDSIEPADRARVERFLTRVQASGAADTYIARNRRYWWRIRLQDPAPILASYMARRPPAFVRNDACARHINIAHGIYPRLPLSERALDRLAAALRAGTEVSSGRTYAGGLTKFEPSDLERLLVPGPDLLARG